LRDRKCTVTTGTRNVKFFAVGLSRLYNSDFVTEKLKGVGVMEKVIVLVAYIDKKYVSC
jgi:hypothetical protein